MPEILQILVPKNPGTLSLWVILIFLIIKNSNKVETRWFSWELQKTKPAPDAKGEIFLKERVLKDFKILKSNVRTMRDRLILYYNQIFKNMFIDFLEIKYTGIQCSNIENNISLKYYLTVFDLISRTIAGTIFIDMVFRNGFPSIRISDKESEEYYEALRKFEEVSKDKTITVLRTIESYIEREWFDNEISYIDFKRFCEEKCEKYYKKIYKESSIYFRTIIEQRDDFIKQIYKDFGKSFDDNETCQKYCELYIRELYE